MCRRRETQVNGPKSVVMPSCVRELEVQILLSELGAIDFGLSTEIILNIIRELIYQLKYPMNVIESIDNDHVLSQHLVSFSQVH